MYVDGVEVVPAYIGEAVEPSAFATAPRSRIALFWKEEAGWRKDVVAAEAWTEAWLQEPSLVVLDDGQLEAPPAGHRLAGDAHQQAHLHPSHVGGRRHLHAPRRGSSRPCERRPAGAPESIPGRSPHRSTGDSASTWSR